MQDRETTVSIPAISKLRGRRKAHLEQGLHHAVSGPHDGAQADAGRERPAGVGRERRLELRTGAEQAMVRDADSERMG